VISFGGCAKAGKLKQPSVRPVANALIRVLINDQAKEGIG